MIYNNDVGHCMGVDCPRKDECYRHWLYQEMPKHKGGAWVVPNGMWNNEGCEDFINKKDYDNLRGHKERNALSQQC